MRNTRSILATALLLTLGRVGGPASIAIAADQTPEEVLKSRGLKRSGTVYILDADPKFVPNVAKLRPSYQQLYSVYRKLAPMIQMQAEYDLLDDQWTVVNEQLRNVQAEIDAHPPLSNNELRQNWQNLLEAERQLKLQYNALSPPRSICTTRLPSYAEKENLPGRVPQTAQGVPGKVQDLRKLVDRIKDDYTALSKDVAVKKSLATLKLSMKGGAFLAPHRTSRKALVDQCREVHVAESLNPKAARKTSEDTRPSGRTRPRTKRRSQRKTSRARAKRRRSGWRS